MDYGDKLFWLSVVIQRKYAQDRRVVMLSATPTGKVLGEAVYAEVAKRLPEIARNLDADDQRDFERVATAIVDTSDLSPPASNQRVTP